MPEHRMNGYGSTINVLSIAMFIVIFVYQKISGQITSVIRWFYQVLVRFYMVLRKVGLFKIKKNCLIHLTCGYWELRYNPDIHNVV